MTMSEDKSFSFKTMLTLPIFTGGFNMAYTCICERATLDYDLARGALAPDTIQGFPVNRNLERLKDARLTLYDSVGAGMTRSSFLLKK